MTGAELHEPKGIAHANSGEVYVANGSGSGAWSNIGTSAFTGMIADFTWLTPQGGWLECNGADISTTTYSALYAVMTTQLSGTIANGTPTVTGISNTSNIRAGYYVFGPGISAGTTVASVDSIAQVTLSGNSSSSGTFTIAFSPWFLNTGTIRLPDLTTSGRFRRSRSSSTSVGQLQADQNQAHIHTATTTGTTDSQGNHTHTATVTDPGHIHTLNAFITSVQNGTAPSQGNLVNTGGGSGVGSPIASNTTGITVANSTTGAHTHNLVAATTVATQGGTEARPLNIVVMTCVKT